MKLIKISRIAYLGTTVGVALILSSCGVTSGEEKSSGEVTVAVAASLTNLDPHSSPDQVNVLVNYGNIAEPLIGLDGSTGEPQPQLAESWEPTNPTTYRFHLRAGVTFQNGEPFDAKAAAFSIERILDPKTKYPLASYFESVDSVHVVDSQTIDLKTKEPDPSIIRNLSYIMMVPPSLAKSAPDALSKKPVGTGPYEFVSKSSSEVKLKRYDKYWGEKPEVDAVVIKAMPEVSGRTAALETKEVDIATDIPAELAKSVPSFRTVPVLENTMFQLDARHGLTSDPRIREAIVLSINRTEIRENVVGKDVSSPTNCQFTPEGVYGFNPDVKEQAYDPAKAKALIEQAGAVGKTISVVGVQGRYPKAEEVVEAAVDQIRKSGLKVDMKILDNASWLDAIYAEGDDRPEAIFLGVNVDQWTALQPFRSVVTEGSQISRFPNSDYPEVEKLIDSVPAETSDEAREATLQEIAAKACDSNAFSFLYGYDATYGAQKNIKWDLRRDNRILFDTIRISD